MRKRVFKKAFGSELQRDDYLTQAPTDAPAPDLADRAVAAWALQDRPAFVRAARAIQRSGGLSPTMALRLARCLFDAGLSEEAREVLQGDGAASSAAAAERSGLIAQIALALGDEPEATEALQQASAAGWSGELAEALDSAIAAVAGRRPPQSWAEARTLVWRCLDIGQADAGVRILAQWLTQATAAAPSDVDEILDLAVAVLRPARPEAASMLTRAVAPIYEATGDGAELARVLGALDGADQPPPIVPARPQDRPRLARQTMLAEACAAAGRWRAAITRFTPTRKQTDATSENLTELARSVGRDLLSSFELKFRPSGPLKVFNLFPFNGELTMLELRLEEMGPWVDHFVIVEAAQTHTGRPKPLHFHERSAAFAGYADKIVHVLADFPPHIASAWARDCRQRDCAIKGISGLCAPDDLVIITDADEIIRRDVLGRLPPGPVAGADLRVFSYFFNYEILYDKPKIKSVIARARILARNGCSYLRFGAPRYLGQSLVRQAGWHFTSIAEPAGLEHKFQNAAHEELSHLDRPYFEALLDRARREGLGPQYARRELGEDFPEALRRRREALANLLL